MQPRGDAGRPYELDQAVASPRQGDGVSWELAAAMAVAWLILAEAGTPWLAGHHLGPWLGSVVGLALEASAGLVVFGAIWLAEVPGGWRQVVTIGRLDRREIRTIGRWTAGQFAARYAVVILVASVSPGVGRGLVSNNPIDAHLAAGPLAVALVSAFVVAPVAEEIFCRGLLLRAIMRRYGFWAGAIASSAIFGLAHAPSQTTAGAAYLVAISSAVFGVIQCILVRRTGRLGPAIAVHALVNAVAALFALGT